MAVPREEEFLSLEGQTFAADDDSRSSPFDTLWTEFARSHPRLSPPRTPTHRQTRHRASRDSSAARAIVSSVDLRLLEYAADYDSNLMCPICHVPFIDPVVLDCDHTFCADCFAEYRNGGPSTDRSKCPSCRSYHLGSSRKASRLIKNMCNDIQVRCPNEGCQSFMARGCVEQHATKECPQQEIACPDPACAKRTRRKNFVPDQCIHNTHIECDCGANIQLGRGEWIKHKDEECPNSLHPDSSTAPSRIGPSSDEETCPGAEFGCTDSVLPSDLEAHTKSCPLAHLAPHLRRQSTLLISLGEQLKMTKIRNEVLETGLDRLQEMITATIQSRPDSLIRQQPHTDHETVSISETEEIPRTDLNSVSFAQHPDMFSLDSSHFHGHDPHRQTQQALYNDLVHRLTSLEQTTQVQDQRLRDLDAQSSMALMNETLRIREELAHINGAMYSTRAQVQWLLNRERIIGQREAMAAGGAGMGLRGRVRAPSAAAGTGPSVDSGSGPSSSSDQNTTPANGPTQTATPKPVADRNMSSAWPNVSQGAGGGMSGLGSGPSSAATSPMFGAARPSLRRSSGGSSQERVKL